jgi:hypothetical protein
VTVTSSPIFISLAELPALGISVPSAAGIKSPKLLDPELVVVPSALGAAA